MSGSEANLYVGHVNDFIKKVKELGPLGKSEGIDKNELNLRLAEVTKLIPYIKIVKSEKLRTPLPNPEENGNYFTKEEIEELFAGVVSYYIDPDKCNACMTCARRCPVEAIISARKQIHVIDQEKCIKCGTCFEACPPKFAA